METNLLRIFKAVAEEESVSKAAVKLHYVQSNVTARIKQLEDYLNCVLFYRKTRGMALTSAGKILLNYANKIVNLIDEAEKIVRESGEYKGSLYIGSMESAAAVRLPPILTQYHLDYPEVEINLTTGTSRELIDKVIHYKIDIAFIGSHIDHPDLEAKPVFDEELVLVTEKKICSLDELKEKTILVFREGCSYRRLLENILRGMGIITYKIMEFSSLDAILGCVAAGMGITLFPESFINSLQYADNLNILKIDQNQSKVKTVLIRRKDTIRTKVMDAFIEKCYIKHTSKCDEIELS